MVSATVKYTRILPRNVYGSNLNLCDHRKNDYDCNTVAAMD